jgi:DNA primase
MSLGLARGGNRSFDCAEIRLQNPIEDEVARHVLLKPNGPEFVGLCPFHQERTPSFKVVPASSDKQGGDGFFHCFGCGAHGDVIEFVRRVYRAEFRQACEILGGSSRSTSAPRITAARPAIDPYAGLVAVTPPPQPVVVGEPLELWNPKRVRVWRCRASAVYTYRDSAQNTLGHVLRIDMPGGKLTPTIRYARRSTCETQWTCWHFDKPRPLYRAEHFRQNGPVVVVEGEKSADAAAELLGSLVTTWPGGGKAVAGADWSLLAGRDLYLWPDADIEGEHAMLGKPAGDGVLRKPGVAELATAAGANIKAVFAWDRSKPKGWDAADALRDGWSQTDAIAWMNRQAHTWNP